ncbi:hypothetical protein DBR19_15960, partial [Aeromonas sp. HMWF014]
MENDRHQHGAFPVTIVILVAKNRLDPITKPCGQGSRPPWRAQDTLFTFHFAIGYRLWTTPQALRAQPVLRIPSMKMY